MNNLDLMNFLTIPPCRELLSWKVRLIHYFSKNIPNLGIGTFEILLVRTQMGHDRWYGETFELCTSEQTVHLVPISCYDPVLFPEYKCGRG